MARSASDITDRILDRLQDYFHIASGPNEDGTHSGFIIVDFGDEAAAEGDAVPQNAMALLPFDLSDEDEPMELTTAENTDGAADAAEDLLAALLELIAGVVEDELSADENGEA